MASHDLGLEHAARPGVGRVRQHLQAMSMQSLGLEGYADLKRSVLVEAEELMTALEEMFQDISTLLAGRGARGQVDGGVTLHIRMYTRRAVGDIARQLVELGYDEPEFETAETSMGRLDRILLETNGVQIVLTRCLMEMRSRSDRDLFTDRRIETADIASLRRLINLIGPG